MDIKRLILLCSSKGEIENVVLDNTSIMEKAKFPVRVQSFIEPESIEQFGNLWGKVLNNCMEEDNLIYFNNNNSPIEMSVSGYLLKDKILICGSTGKSNLQSILSDIMKINNEQQNIIRIAKKKNVKSQHTKSNPDQDLLNDFTQLNNELINKHRELERRKAEIEKLNNELESARDNMQMYVYAITHDLKEPVRMVKSFMTLLNDKYGNDLDENAKNYINFAVDGAERLNKMINDLLEYYRAGNSEEKDENINLEDVLREVLALLKIQIEEKGAEITHDQLPFARGTESGWKQVFQNLISNALKYVEDSKKPQIHIGVEEKEDHWQMVVQDNGIGIPEAGYSKVFDIFHRLQNKSKYSGTGVGLALVKKNLENIGGKIWVEAKVGEGSKFYFTFPK